MLKLRENILNIDYKIFIFYLSIFNLTLLITPYSSTG